MADIKKISIAGTQYDVKDANALRTADQGNLLPNFDSMAVLQTIEFDTSDSNYHTIFTRTNTETNPKDVVDTVYFRITVTGTNINQVADCAWIMKGQANVYPTLVINYKPGTSDNQYGGFRYIREIYPKALNNGYDWALDVAQNRNNNARHYKVEVFKTNSKYTWTQGTTSIYNGTYHNTAQYGAETTSGYFINYLNGTVGQAGNASGLNDRLSKVLNTNFPAGEALLANQFVYMNNNKIYPASNKTTAIESGFGVQFNTTAYNANNDVGWDRLRQKCRNTNLTNIPHATLARGNPCYFRCTMDSSGNILSDNYVDTSMGNGYTWYYVGVAESSTVITIDTTQSFFITLDSSGNLTHINGKRVSVDLSGYVPTSRKVNNKALSSDITLTASDVGALPSSTVIPTVNNATLTIQKNGTTVKTFTANASSNVTANITVPTKTSDLTNDDGFITGITSNDVTTALGYTPYNSNNPSGYQANVIETVKVNGTALTPSSKAVNVSVPTETTVSGWGFTKNSGTVTSVNNVSPVNGNVTLSIPAAQIQSDWTQTNTSSLDYIKNKPITGQVHVVIESYHNGYDWYRIYDDGWCEQGGSTPYGVNSATVTLHKEFLDTNYVVMISLSMLTNTSTDTGGRGDAPETSNFTTTSFRVSQPNASNRCTIWEAKGFIS